MKKGNVYNGIRFTKADSGGRGRVGIMLYQRSQGGYYGYSSI